MLFDGKSAEEVIADIDERASKRDARYGAAKPDSAMRPVHIVPERKPAAEENSEAGAEKSQDTPSEVPAPEGEQPASPEEKPEGAETPNKGEKPKENE